MNTLFAAILKRHYLVYAFAFSCVLAVSPSGAQTVDLDFIMSNYNVQIKASAVDASGNIIVTGTYYSSTVFTYDFDPGAGVVAPFQNNINTAVPVNFIAKYTSAGAFVWLIDGYNDATVAANEISDVHVDSNNNIYVVGSSSGGPVTFRDKSTPGINTAVGGTFLTNTNLYGAYVIKFNSSGIKQWSWNRATSGSLVDFYGKGIKTDASGNVFVAGTYSNASFQTTGAVWKLNSSGVQQSQNFVTSVGSEINDVAIDGAGNVYVTGIFKNTVDFDATAATQNITADANGDVFVAKYSSAFGYVWATKLTTTSSQDIGKKIVLDGSGNVFVLGKGGANQLLLNKVNTSGTSIASFALTSSTSFDPHHLKISSSNNIYVSGSKVGSTDFDPGAGTISGTSKYLAKYSNALAFQYVYGLGDVMSSGTALAINSQDKLVTADSYLSNSRVIVLSEDVTPPTINAFSPLDGATGVAITANLVATFSENVTPVASKVVSIKRSSDNAVFESYTLPSANVSVSGSTVTINPTGSLVNSTGYYVTMDAGAFQDVSGNAFAGITNTTTWNFTTVAAADVTPPTISSLLPSDGATGVAVASNLVATFSENVTAVSSKVVSIKYAGGEVPGGIFESYTLPSANVTVSGNTVTINPTSNLANLAEYYVNIETGAFIDAAGNPFAGISNATSWNFTAVPASAPIATAFYPVNNATNVPVGVNSFFIAFDDFIQVNQSALGTVQLKKLDGTVVFETTAPNISTCCQNVPFYMGEAVLEPATTYYFNIGNDIFRKSGGVSYYTGISNNTAWRFTTGSVNSVISSFLPARGATSVSTSLGSIKMYFSSQVYDSYGYYRLRKVSDNSLVKQWDVYADITYGYDAQAGLYFAELPLSNALEAGTSYYIDNQFNNAGGNEPGWMEYDFAYNESEDIWTTARIVPWATNFWTFTTVPAADAIPPTITSLSPTDGAASVAVASNLVATFSESVVAVASKVVSIKRSTDNSVFASYTLPSANVVVSGTTVTINPASDLAFGVGYYVNIESGAFTDAAGNPFAGITNTTSWNFSTPAALSLVSLSPANGATGVDKTTNLTLTFSENVNFNSLAGGIHIYNANGTLKESLSVYNALNMSVIGASITFNFTNDLADNSEYYVNISDGYLISSANATNTWAGIQNSTSWRFTTAGAADVTPPTITNLSPADNATGVAVNGNLIVTFSENIVANTGVITIRDIGGSMHSSYSVNGGVSISNNTLTITPAYDLSASTEYYVDLGVGVVKDVSGNTFEGLNGNPNWTFTTQALQVSALSYTPANSSTNVQVSSNLSITFEENMTISAGTISLYRVSNGSLITSLSNYNGSAMTIDGATVSFDLPNDLPANTEVYVNVTGGYLRSAVNGQKIWPGIQDNTTWRFTTGKLDQTVTFNALPAKAFGEAPFALTATASSGLTVSYTSSNTAVATVSGNTVTIVGVGSTTITASQTGNANYNAAANVPQTLTVNKGSQTITFAALPAKTFGDANFTLGATASSGLAVSYASSNTSVATVSGNTVTIVGAGSTTITASQTGNANYNAATNVPQTLTVNKASQTITFAALPAKTFGDANFTLGATASSGLTVSYASSNTAVATVSGNTVTIVGAGSTTITASQTGNANYNAAANVPQTLTVNKAGQTITFAALPAKTFGDANFTLGATSSSGLSVSYASSNTAVATVSGNTVTIVGAGSTTITASQAGNANYNAATNVPQTLTVDKASQTITVSPIADKLVSDAPFAVSASTTSGLSLTYAIASGPATISGNTITLTGASGTVEVAVSQAGNTNYNSASSSASFFVSDPDKANQTITFAELPAKAFGDTSFSPGATASSGLTVSYTSSNLSVATLSGNMVTITGVGSTTITASQAGDAAFNAAPPVERTLTVSKGSQTLTFDAISDKSFGDAAFTLSPSASSSLVVSLEVVNGPVTLSGTEITITGAGTATIKATQAGNENFNAALPVERTFTIAKKAQVITIADIEDKLTTDAAFDLVASVDSDLALSYSIDGPATLSGATVTLTGEEGTVTITVSQGGNENYLAADAATTFEVTAPEVAEKQEQTITFAAIADKTFGDAAFDLEATSTSELAVSFEVVSGPVSIDGNTVTITGAGTATLRASQAGDETFQAAVAVERSFAIAKKAQTIVVESIGGKLTTDGPIAVNATTDSGLELSYSVTGPASLTGTTLTLTGVEGTVTVTANQVGNDNYLAAEATEAFEVTAPVVKALSVAGVATIGSSPFTQGEAKLHPKNSNGTFGTPIISALSANGAFTFDDVPAGQYALSIASASPTVVTTYFEKATTLANATLLTLSAESIEGVTVDMIEKPSLPAGPGSIAGKLLLSDDGSRHLVTDGRLMEGSPLSGVTILLMTSPEGTLVASTVTAVDGSFEFTNLPLGAYKLLIDYEGNVSLESPEITISTGQLSFEVASEVTDEGIVIIAMPTATTGVSAEVLRSMIKTYPNPSQGQFTIAWDGSLADVKEIIIHNNNGSAVWQHSMTTAQLTVDISSQPAGVYILRLITSHGAAVHKLVIK
ncbi:MAG: Ig-like domain-containing protein [Imperialibacter sp.]|uniref:Ig-like domain-containing protein n=1 Tax=Imperialibacter sp. TaxID=2038411 RepID=UPI0032EF3551